MNTTTAQMTIYIVWAHGKLFAFFLIFQLTNRFSTLTGTKNDVNNERHPTYPLPLPWTTEGITARTATSKKGHTNMARTGIFGTTTAAMKMATTTATTTTRMRTMSRAGNVDGTVQQGRGPKRRR
jgi:hypothetical protein